MKYHILILVIFLSACGSDELPKDPIENPPTTVTPPVVTPPVVTPPVVTPPVVTPPVVTPPVILPEWTEIPDVNFEKNLITLGIDDILDGKVLTSKVSELKTLSLNHTRIKDMTGIRSFISLEFLDLWDNDFTSIDLTQNTKLKTLGLSECPIDKIDISKNTELIEIDFQNNDDRVNDPTYPYGKSLGIKELDLTSNTKLERLYIWVTRIAVLDVSMCPRLDNLWINSCPIKRLDLSKNPKLDVFVADNAELEFLNIRGTNNNGVPRTCKTDHNPNLKEILVTNIERINAWRNTYINQGANLVSESWWAKDEQTKYVE